MILISFLLDGILSIYLYKLIPLFTLTSIVIASYYKKADSLIKYTVLIGILYDVVYTNTIILNSIIFFFLSLLLIKLNKKFNKNYFNILFINTIIITLYLVVTYIILVLFNYLNFNIIYMTISILKSLIINNIYISFLYLIMHKKRFYA